MKIQFRVQAIITIVLFTVLFFLTLSGCSQSPPGNEIATVRAHVIDSLKAIYEELKANDLEMTDTGVETYDEIRTREAMLAAGNPDLAEKPKPVTASLTGQYLYKGELYPIQTGPKGGKYFIYMGKKKYIPKTN